MNLTDFLQLSNPEEYDLKDEKGYAGESSLEKMLNYKKARDGFDCDGSGEGNEKGLCMLIREIYRTLWGFQDRYICDKNNVKRYAESIYSDGFLMGPETMNSFSTTQTLVRTRDLTELIEDRLEIFSALVGRVGNMTLTFAGFNKYICKDYWDLKIERQYLNNEVLSSRGKVRYINLFFMWDYVSYNSEKKVYTFKPLFDGHDQQSPLPNNDTGKQIAQFIDAVDKYTKRRGAFMVALLRIGQNNKEDLEKIMEYLSSTDKLFGGFKDAVHNIRKDNEWVISSDSMKKLKDLEELF